MRLDFYDNPEYKRKQSAKTKDNWLKGTFDFKGKPIENRLCRNLVCNNYFQVKSYSKKVFCSSRCSAIINNSNRYKKNRLCIVCNKTRRHGHKYCSFQCQSEFHYKQFISRWKLGLESGSRGINTKTISNHVRHYLINKYGEKCSECNWSKKNTFSDRIPLEVDHKDGNAENNLEDNLRLLCPNCHSLTPYFRNLNRGRGRSWRKAKYIKGNSMPNVK